MTTPATDDLPNDRILKVTEIFSELTSHHDLFPLIPTLTNRVLRELAAERFEKSPRALTAVEIAEKVRANHESLSRAINALPGLLAYYTPDHGVTLTRERLPKPGSKGGQKSYGYRLTVNFPNDPA
jgi:hypothetical protein